MLDCSVSEAVAFLESLDPQLFGPFFPDVEQVVRSCVLLPLEDKRSGVKLDLAIGVSGFEKMIIERATAIEIAGQVVRVATSEDLVFMKVLAGRPQDDQDVQGILVANASDMDWHYCVEVAAQLQEAVGIDLVSKISKLRTDLDKPKN